MKFLFLLFVSTFASYLTLEKVRDNLIHPVSIIDGPQGLLVAEQIGKVIDLDGDIYLDLTDRVFITNLFFDEKGLLSIVSTNDNLYVAYSYNHTSLGQVVRVSAFDHETKTETIILDVPQTTDSNKGGHLFLDEEYLYLTLGDGGDPNSVQDNAFYTGKILRFNSSLNNPVPEVYAKGFRNPWRCFKDENIFICGDPGTEEIEEINLIEENGNYGWNILEGNICLIEGCNKTGLIPPEFFYHTRTGSAIIGGVIVGPSIKDLEGKYLFADFALGLRTYDLETQEMENIDVDVDSFVFGFNRDQNENIYVLTSDIGLTEPTGIIYKLIEKADRNNGGDNGLSNSDYIFIIVTSGCLLFFVCLGIYYYYKSEYRCFCTKTSTLPVARSVSS